MADWSSIWAGFLIVWLAIGAYGAYMALRLRGVRRSNRRDER